MLKSIQCCLYTQHALIVIGLRYKRYVLLTWDRWCSKELKNRNCINIIHIDNNVLLKLHHTNRKDLLNEICLHGILNHVIIKSRSQLII